MKHNFFVEEYQKSLGDKIFLWTSAFVSIIEAVARTEKKDHFAAVMFRRIW
jgi:hypothetical protein